MFEETSNISAVRRGFKPMITRVKLLFNSKLTRLKQQLLQIVLLGLALLMLQTSLTATPLVKRPLAPSCEIP